MRCADGELGKEKPSDLTEETSRHGSDEQVASKARKTESDDRNVKANLRFVDIFMVMRQL